MGTISELLRYKDEVKLLDPKTNKKLASVWIRILGDESIKDAYKYSRLASAQKRTALTDTTSIDYLDEVASLNGQDTKDLHDLVVASMENDFTSEAVVVVQREEIPELEDIATEPDAPTLKEQELLDKEEVSLEERFTKKIDDFVATKKVELEVELAVMSYEDLLARAQVELTKVLPMQIFLEELRNQKGFRATYGDKDYKTKAFTSIEEYKDTHPAIKDQIMAAYDKLEMGPDDIKK